MNEAETRAELIDPLLAAAGWGVVEGSRIRREYPITLGRLEGSSKRGKGLTADYVLEFRNTKLATMEAKARDKAVTEGVGQTKNYAGKMGLRFASRHVDAINTVAIAGVGETQAQHAGIVLGLAHALADRLVPGLGFHRGQ
ncbi:MAG: hypothetical protein ACKN9W_08740, partial [Methylococcus sp.]